MDKHGHPLVEVEVGGSRTTVKLAALLDSGFDGELSHFGFSLRRGKN